jgi:DNA-binding GntR family transcriptional regulator
VVFKPLESEALGQQARKVLREAIISMTLKPGQPLIERQIAQSLGISTTPVRFAIQQLAHEGLVTITLNRSATVSRLTPDDFREIYEMREVLEPVALRKAAALMGIGLVQEMEGILAESAAAIAVSDFGRLAESNRAFNDCFVGGCGNGRLRVTLENLHTQTQRIGAVAWKYRRTAPLDHEQHLRILDAVRREDWDEADTAVREHLSSAYHENRLAFEQFLRDLKSGPSDAWGRFME